MLLVWFAFAVVAMGVTVKTPCGDIVGSEVDGLYVFEGVEFGTAARFEHSVPAQCWNGTRTATKVGPACWQQGNPDQGGLPLVIFFCTDDL